MTFKKYLSVLTLTLLCANFALNAKDFHKNMYSEYSLGDVVDSALNVPERAVEDATDIAEAPVDTILGEDEMYYNNKPKYTDEYLVEDADLYTGADMSDDMESISDDSLNEYNYQNYNYHNYGYDAADTDILEKETDYNPELE